MPTALSSSHFEKAHRICRSSKQPLSVWESTGLQAHPQTCVHPPAAVYQLCCAVTVLEIHTALQLQAISSRGAACAVGTGRLQSVTLVC